MPIRDALYTRARAYGVFISPQLKSIMLSTSLVFAGLDYLFCRHQRITSVIPAGIVYIGYPIMVRVLAVRHPFSYIPAALLGVTVFGMHNMTHSMSLSEKSLGNAIGDTISGTFITMCIAVLESAR